MAENSISGEPIPDKLVVLTFGDAVKSHRSVVRPILKKYSFGAKSFVTEGFDFPTKKTDYMTWVEAEFRRIRALLTIRRTVGFDDLAPLLASDYTAE